ncbi:MAG: response regulator [Bacteroidia bacterium]|nr:response regulator [Bacteroidia bacterium]
MKTSSVIKILLVEDDEDDYFIIKDYLSEAALQFEIEWVNNYNSFIEHLNNTDADLVITDYLLGSTSGIEVLKKVKEVNPVLPVMILTGKGNTSIDMEAMKLGAADYLIKGSFDASSLERSVRYVIERSNSIKILKENEHYQSTLSKLSSTDRIVKMLAHEVKNPLTSILLCAEQLKELLGDNEEMATYIDIIARNSSRINLLVSNLLDSTRFGDVKLEKLNVIDVLKATVLLATDRIKLSGINLIESYPEPYIAVEIDEEKMKIALLNIIINAVEALEVGKGSINIKVIKDQKNVRIHIIDNGPGMTDETKEKLFEPFFTSKPKGSGLGLASVQNIILSHRGKIEVVSKPANGAEFIISLPMVE